MSTNEFTMIILTHVIVVCIMLTYKIWSDCAISTCASSCTPDFGRCSSACDYMENTAFHLESHEDLAKDKLSYQSIPIQW